MICLGKLFDSRRDNLRRSKERSSMGKREPYIVDSSSHPSYDLQLFSTPWYTSITLELEIVKKLSRLSRMTRIGILKESSCNAIRKLWHRFVVENSLRPK